MKINSPQFSFVQFGECLQCYGPDLEVKNASDICFQILVSEAKSTAIEYVIATDTGAELFRSKLAPLNTLNDQYLYFIQPSADLYELLTEGRCFKFGIADIGEPPVQYSNSFKYSPRVEYTTLLDYRCDEEIALGFCYPNGVFNRIRVPVRIYKPQHKETRNVYSTRSGKQLILSASIAKEFELETDWISEDFHDKLNIALIHDVTLFDGKQYTKSADYKIEWDDNETNIALATCKVLENIIQRNINCGGSSKMSDSIDLQKLIEIVTSIWPIGSIIDYAGDITKIPEHWELCDGGYSEVLSKDRPDFRGRVSVGYGSFVENGITYGYEVGQKGGEAKHLLTIEEMPEHDHSIRVSKNPIRHDGWSDNTVRPIAENTGLSIKTDKEGSAEGHENRQPYYVTAKIIRVSNPII